jgi:hypothetical protein
VNVHHRHLLLAATVVLGCYQGPPSATENDPPEPANTTGSHGDSEGSSSGDAARREAEPPTLPEGADRVELLPFEVRMRKLAGVVGVGVEHFMFTELRDLSLSLGDAEPGLGVDEDLAWTPERMRHWVAALQPVCSSQEFATRFADVGETPDELVQAAWGRAPNEAERDALGQVALQFSDPDTRRRFVCLAVLSSLDFVAR